MASDRVPLRTLAWIAGIGRYWDNPRAEQRTLDIRMKEWLIVLAAFVAPVQASVSNDLADKVWIHGSKDCAANQDPALEVFRFDADSYILRQNKCVDFEAPFIYVLFGQHTVFVLDTGATADPSQFPLYETVRSLIAQGNRHKTRIFVAHSHSHGDHRAADPQFRDKPGVTLVEPNAKAVRKYFGFSTWPNGTAKVDLGGRILEVVPAPGHQDEGIAVYDSRTGWLLTGDNLYPGRLYVRNWNEFRSSVARLVKFSKGRRISAVLGAHIEMSSSGNLFEAGSTFQPDEADLALAPEDLSRIDQLLREAGDESREIVTARFVVVPIDAFWRVLGDVVGWFSGS
jgi:hydroxyacylglutathione hydrolase